MGHADFVEVVPFLKQLRGTANAASLGEYPCYAVTMITRRNRVADLLAHLHEIHHATGRHILVVAPELPLEGVPGPAETARALAEGFFLDGTGNRRELDDKGARFLSDVEELIFAVADELGLPRADLPCVVFLATVVLPGAYVAWKLPADNTVDALVDGLNAIADAVVRADARGESVLDAIVATRPAETRRRSLV